MSSVFTEEGAARLTRRLLGQHPEGLPAEAINRWLHWCEQAELNAALLKMVEKGELVARFDFQLQDFVFSDPGKPEPPPA
jgi:hypothetical protein